MSERPVIQDVNGMYIKRAVVDGKAITATFDPSAKRILEENVGIRNSQIVKQKADMHWALSMSPMQYAQICKRYPDLKSEDGEIQTKAWKKFITSSESKPYRVT
jgi:hypothetical protein